MIAKMSGRPGKDQSKAPDFQFRLNLTLCFQNFSATKLTHSSACLTVAGRGDNQMAIAKKTRDMLLPTLRIHREHASSHLRGPVYASMM